MLILRTILSLALVIALIVFLAWIARRFLKPDRWLVSRQLGSIKVLERLALDPKKSLMIIEWESRRLLVGVTEASIQTLGAMDGASSVNDTKVERQIPSGSTVLSERRLP